MLTGVANVGGTGDHRLAAVCRATICRRAYRRNNGLNGIFNLESHVLNLVAERSKGRKAELCG
jgi:hypothetical protein